MENSGLLLEAFYNLHGLELSPIHNHKEFLIQLVKLSHFGIEKDTEAGEIEPKITRLLDYVIRTEDSELVQLMLETLVKIQIHTKLALVNNYININQLCILFAIEFSQYKADIYFNTLKLIQFLGSQPSGVQIGHILKSKLMIHDGNIFECFDLALSLELLHTCLIFDWHTCEPLLMGILVHWEYFETPIKEEWFEKLLWYGFAFNQDNFVKKQITEYKRLFQSERWGIKFYRFVTKNLAQTGPIHSEKMERAIQQFSKLKSYSAAEKEFILQKLDTKLKEKASRAIVTQPKASIEPKVKKTPAISNSINQTNKVNPEKKADPVFSEITKLSPYNLPQGISLNEIKEERFITLAVFENQKMTKILKVIKAKVLFTPKYKNIFFANKTMLKIIKKDAYPGYVHVLNDQKNKPKKAKIKTKAVTSSAKIIDSFAWPSTTVLGSGTDSENDFNGLNEKSALRKMGYQITNSTREMRWSALQRAVPAMGLKKVANTIASHIKLRKGQKNGREKFNYAISEWQHDLNRLKSTYYKKDFTWPIT